MSDPETDPAALAAEAAKMTDEELLDSWQTTSAQEKQAPSPFLRSIADEMNRRGIAA